MYSQAALDILADVLDQEASSIVRYLQEVAQLRPADEADAQVQAVLEQLYAESCLDMGALSALLGEHAAVFPSVAWELEYSRFNFLRPGFLVEPVVESIREHLENAGKLAAALGEAEWEEARQAVERLIARQSASLDRLEGLAPKPGKPGSEPPQRSGTSASRW